MRDQYHSGKCPENEVKSKRNCKHKLQYGKTVNRTKVLYILQIVIFLAYQGLCQRAPRWGILKIKDHNEKLRLYDIRRKEH